MPALHASSLIKLLDWIGVLFLLSFALFLAREWRLQCILYSMIVKVVLGAQRRSSTKVQTKFLLPLHQQTGAGQSEQDASKSQAHYSHLCFPCKNLSIFFPPRRLALWGLDSLVAVQGTIEGKDRLGVVLFIYCGEAHGSSTLAFHHAGPRE